MERETPISGQPRDPAQQGATGDPLEVAAELVSGDSDAGSGSDCDGWVFDDDGGYEQDEAYDKFNELFQWAVE